LQQVALSEISHTSCSLNNTGRSVAMPTVCLPVLVLRVLTSHLLFPDGEPVGASRSPVSGLLILSQSSSRAVHTEVV